MNIPYPLKGVWAQLKCPTQRSKAELLGIIEGVLADGAIVEPEARFLMDWIRRHADIRNQWPGDVLFARIEAMLADGVLDLEEQRELLGRLMDYQILRDRAQQTEAIAPAVSSAKVSVRSPYDDPLPPIEHMGRVFVVTGEFACGKRGEIAGKIESLGGTVANAVSKKVHFVVIGSLGSDLWKTDGYGTKIEKAIELRMQHVPVALVPESHWYETVRVLD
jgi:hypothetical protein